MKEIGKRSKRFVWVKVHFDYLSFRFRFSFAFFQRGWEKTRKRHKLPHLFSPSLDLDLDPFFSFLKNKKQNQALGPLTVLIFSTSLTVGAHLGCDPAKRAPNPRCVRVVGPIPKGLPRETVTWWFPMSHFKEKMGVAALVCAIDLMESVSIAVSSSCTAVVL
jgi:hypothetical protein